MVRPRSSRGSALPLLKDGPSGPLSPRALGGTVIALGDANRGQRYLAIRPRRVAKRGPPRRPPRAAGSLFSSGPLSFPVGPRSTAASMAAMAVRKVLLASPRGYCAGVERAVETVEKALDLYGPPVYVRKQIVHN